MGWGKDKDVEALEKKMRELQLDCDLKLKKAAKDHELVLAQKDFDMKHLKDNEILKLKAEIVSKDNQITKLETKNLMLDKLVDLNADVIDVKSLVTQLIGKLPEVKISSLSVMGDCSSKADKK